MKHIHISKDTAKLILRLTIGILVLFHGIAKIQNPGSIDFIQGLLEAKHLPGFIAYGIYVGEVVAPLMLIVGFRTRFAAGVIAFTLLMAVFLAHLDQLFALAKMGGGYALELQALYFFGALAIIGLGSGKYALGEDTCCTCSTGCK
jgi:putative oxidoreductase